MDFANNATSERWLQVVNELPPEWRTRWFETLDAGPYDDQGIVHLIGNIILLAESKTIAQEFGAQLLSPILLHPVTRGGEMGS